MKQNQNSFFLPVITSLIILSFLGCRDTSDSADSTETIDDGDGLLLVDPADITNQEFVSRTSSCEDYTGEYIAEVQDVQRGMTLSAELRISASGGRCTFNSNSIPNHDFNAEGHFATPVSEVQATFEMTASPTAAGTPTALSLETDNAIFLNGVKLDQLAAACYGVGNEPLGEEKIGCNQDYPWRYNPSVAGFGVDEHNAHTQPDGAYHYHGASSALYDTSGAVASGVIGFAADGFPIFGPYIADGSRVRRVVSGYRLKEGRRTSIAGEAAFPGGNYDGTYVDDYEWTDAGDLDACNGMTRDGVYGYYVTEDYPYVLGCFTGTPDPSFNKR